MPTQAELERRARTDTGKKSFAQDVKDRLAAGKSIEQAMSEARSGREQTIDPTTGAPVFGGVRRGTAGDGIGAIEDPAIAAREAQERLLRAQREAQIAGLRGARTGSLAALEQQRGRVEPAFLQQRTGLRTQAQQAGRQTEASLAARGLARSGAQTQSDIARQIALQQGLTESGQQQAEVLAGIAAGEAGVERQFQTGLAQAEAGAATQQAQFEIEQIRAQQAAGVRAGELESARTFQIQQQAQADLITQRMREADLAIEDARRTQDYEREDQLLRLRSDLDKEAIRLRAQLTPARGGGAGGLTFTQERTVFQDRVRSGLAGIESVLAGLPEGTPVAQQDTAVINQLRNLIAQGADPSVVNEMARQAGLTSPEDQARIFTTTRDIAGGVQMPTSREIYQKGLTTPGFGG